MPIKLSNNNKLSRVLPCNSGKQISSAPDTLRAALAKSSCSGAGTNSACIKRNCEARLLKRIIDISNGNFKTLKPLLASGVMLLLVVCSFVFSVILNALPTYAAITLSVSSSDETFNLLPGKFNSSNPVNISVSTDDDGGYNLSISGPEDNILLKSGTTNAGLNSISENKLSTNFSNNEFGIKYCKSTNTTCINSETYISAPGNDLLQIDKTTDSNSAPATYALSVGAKVDASAQSGDSYSGNFVIFASANATSYSINYVDPQDSWPASTTGSTTGTKINLSNVTPTKSGYTFNGWCSVYTDDGTCSGTTYQPGEEYELSNGAITNLYAMWGGPCDNKNKIQDIDNWRNQLNEVGSTLTVCDARDNREYVVGKLADGKIWMLDNLAFTGQDASGNYIEMNNTNTNVPWAAGSTDAITWSNDGSNERKNVVWSSQSNTYTAPLLQDNSDKPTSGDTNGGLAAATTVNWKYGVHYNYCAATVEQDGMCKNSQSSNATQSVCPAGWRLPTGGSGGEFATIYGKYNAYKTFREALRLPLSGNVSSGTLNNGGSYGDFWSSTRIANTNMYYLYFDTSSVDATDYSNRYYGYSVRCVAP